MAAIVHEDVIVVEAVITAASEDLEIVRPFSAEEAVSLRELLKAGLGLLWHIDTGLVVCAGGDGIVPAVVVLTAKTTS